MTTYYITDRTQFPGGEADRRRALLAKIAEAACGGVDYIQLREKDLSARELELLAREAVGAIKVPERTGGQQKPTRLLINSRIDVALSTGAHGVHLRGADVSPRIARSVWAEAHRRNPHFAAQPVIAVSCHTPADVERAAEEGADFAVLAPLFEKHDQLLSQPTGLDALHAACQAPIPVLALGGVTLENAASCIAAGAAGIAGIRLFQQNEVSIVVHALDHVARHVQSAR